MVSDRNHSFELLRKSRQCALNIPTLEIAEQVVRCGNSNGATTDKFEKLGLTRRPPKLVRAPLIEECFASLECQLADTRMVPKYGFFVLQVLKAGWIPPTPTPAPCITAVTAASWSQARRFSCAHG